MKALAVLAWLLSALLGLVAFAAFLTACWAHGDDADRWVGTGFVTLVAGVALGAASAAAWERSR